MHTSAKAQQSLLITTKRLPSTTYCRVSIGPHLLAEQFCIIITRRVRPPNGGLLHEPPSPVSTARPMWLTSGRISHEVVYAGRRGGSGGPQAGAGGAGRPAPVQAGTGLCRPLHAGIYQRRSRRIG